jgi:hypothetical protein
MSWGSVQAVRRLVIALAVAAAGCSLSSTGSPNPVLSGTGGTGSFGAGGTVVFGMGGSGGAPMVGGCAGGGLYASCISSCGDDSPPTVMITQICDQGTPRCPDGTVSVDTCAPTSCYELRLLCCDPTTGDSTRGICQEDGTRACPAGTVIEQPYGQPYGTCIPTALEASGCTMTLDHQPCAGPAHACQVDSLFCVCAAFDGDTETLWHCSYSLI